MPAWWEILLINQEEERRRKKQEEGYLQGSKEAREGGERRSFWPGKFGDYDFNSGYQKGYDMSRWSASGPGKREKSALDIQKEILEEQIKKLIK